VVVSNTGSAATTVTLGIYESKSGAKLGNWITTSIPVSGQVNLSRSRIDWAAKILPSSGASAVYQYKVIAESTFTGFLQHLVTNKQAGGITDMTPCRCISTREMGTEMGKPKTKTA